MPSAGAFPEPGFGKFAMFWYRPAITVVDSDGSFEEELGDYAGIVPFTVHSRTQRFDIRIQQSGTFHEDSLLKVLWIKGQLRFNADGTVLLQVDSASPGFAYLSILRISVFG